jgi:hypothetical protein
MGSFWARDKFPVIDAMEGSLSRPLGIKVEFLKKKTGKGG